MLTPRVFQAQSPATGSLGLALLWQIFERSGFFGIPSDHFA